MHKQETRNKVTPNVNARLEEAVVDKGEHITVSHVDETHKNGKLHLVRVGKEKVVFSSMPCRIETKSVNTNLATDNGFALLPVLWPNPSRFEESERTREEIIVKETSVDGKETHEKQNVTTTISHVENFIALNLGNFLFVNDKSKSSKERRIP